MSLSGEIALGLEKGEGGDRKGQEVRRSELQFSLCRSRISSPQHWQVWDYYIPSLTGTVGMCVARLGGGDFKLAARSPSQSPNSHPSLFRQRQLAGPCDKEPAEFI